MTTRLLLVRHGNTDAVGKALAGESIGFRLDAAGREQVRELSVALAAARLEAVYTSPHRRAVETAQTIAAPHDLQPRTCEALAELAFGRFAGRRFEELESDPLWGRFNRFRSGVRLPGGELLIEVQARAISALERLAADHPAGTLAVISHADVIRSVIAHYLGSPLDLLTRLELDPASVTLAELTPESVRIGAINVRAAGLFSLLG